MDAPPRGTREVHFELDQLIQAVGYVGLFGIIFAESGLLVGVFLPGDSLLFTAGLLASQGHFSLPLLAGTCVSAAITGDAVGYLFGRRVGRRLFDRPDSRWFKREHLLLAEAFYAKHGGKAIILARFLPVVRTFAPIVAGAAGMHYPRFALYNVLGGLLWGAGLTVAGYVVGNVAPDVDRYLLPIILGIILVSVLPTGLHLARERLGRVAPTVRARLLGRAVAVDPDAS
jgi:membrane-associated protein